MNFLTLVSGKIKEFAGLVVSTGATDAGKIPALDGTGKLDLSVLPTGIGADTKSIIASEAIAAGAFVNIYSNAGVITIRNADASSNAKEANGFVLAAVSSSANGTVYFRGSNPQQSGMTVGALQFLSATTPGAVTATAPTGTGKIVQQLGKANSATEMNVGLQQTVELA